MFRKDPPPLGLLRSFAVSCTLGVVFLSGVAFASDATPIRKQQRGAVTDSSSQSQAEQLRTSALHLVQKATLQDLIAATRELRQSASLFLIARQESAAASDYLSIGDIYFTRSQFNEALRMYRFGLSLDKQLDLRCYILSHIAILYGTIGRMEQSRHYAKLAQAASRRSRNPESQAEASEALGLTALYSRNPQQALALFRGAAETFKATGNVEAQAGAIRYLGWTLGQLGYTEEALTIQNDGLRLWESAGNSYGVAQAHAALGLLWAFLGETDTALAEYEEASQRFKAVDDRDSEAVILNGLGLISSQLGNYEKSLKYFHQAKRIFAAVGDEFGEMGAIDGAAGSLLHLQDYRRAKSLYTSKLRRAQRARHYRNEADALANLADVDALQHQYRRAEALYRQAIALCRSAHDAWDELRISLSFGHLYTQMGQYQSAERSLRQAFRLAESNREVARQAEASYELANLFRTMRRYDEAKLQLGNAIQIIESERTKVSDFDSRATYFASVHNYYQLYIDTLMELEQQDPGQGFAQRAFEAAEKSKVRSLLDMLASSQQRSDCAQVSAPSVDGPGQRDHMLPDQQCSPAPSALDLRQVQEEIGGDDAVVLEYALGPRASYLWAVDQEHIFSYRLPGGAQILRLATRFRNSLVARQPIAGESAEHRNDRVTRADDEAKALAQQLSQLLLGPAADHLPAKKRVVVVPEGSLQYIPFAALRLPGSSEAGGEAMSAQYEVVTLPSASILKVLRDAAANSPQPKQVAAVFADPVFSKSDERLAQRVASSIAPHAAPVALGAALRDVPFGSGTIPRLPASRKEAEDIASAFLGQPVFLAMDFDASRNTVLSSNLGQYRYLHFATHGILDAVHPEFSGLVLSLINQNGEPEDGYLRLQDIYRLKLSADLVVLSSCNSSLGKDLESEGIIGLPRAFLYAGARRVISTLWKVDDQATAAFMQHFYFRLGKGESPASALREAQFDLAKDPLWHNPYYWAGFILQGEYR